MIGIYSFFCHKCNSQFRLAKGCFPNNSKFSKKSEFPKFSENVKKFALFLNLGTQTLSVITTQNLKKKEKFKKKSKFWYLKKSQNFQQKKLQFPKFSKNLKKVIFKPITYGAKLMSNTTRKFE